MSEPDLPDQPLLGLLLRLLHQHWAQDIDAALSGAGFGGIRPHHASVFPFVPPEGIQVSALAKLARVRKQTMAEAIDQLERLGYVERRPNPHDRRARLVFLTERGNAVRPVTHAAGRQVEERWADLAGSKDIEHLRATLRHLLTELAHKRNDGV
jgi:DNA-binding MarR family transcriptional regulator